jgi:hypothetical protein
VRTSGDPVGFNFRQVVSVDRKSAASHIEVAPTSI